MRKRRVIAGIATGALVGIIAGAVVGIGARVAMRMVADGMVDFARIRPEFTIGGTVAVVIFGALFGMPAGVLFNAIQRRLPGPRLLRGALFGLLCLAAVGPFFFRTEEFFSLGRVLIFAALFPLFGIALVLASGPSRTVITRLPLPAHGALALAAVMTGGLVLFGIVAAALGLSGPLVM